MRTEREQFVIDKIQELTGCGTVIAEQAAADNATVTKIDATLDNNNTLYKYQTDDFQTFVVDTNANPVWKEDCEKEAWDDVILNIFGSGFDV